MLPAALVYDPVTNPTGTRCGDPDLAAAVWGTTAGIAPGVRPARSALQTIDNVGIQYGLKALLAGAITPEEFVTLNEKIGGIDADSNRTAARCAADPAALDIAYRSGIVSSGKNLGKVADHRLARLRRAGASTTSGAASPSAPGSTRTCGDHGNQVMWRYGTGLHRRRGADRGGDAEVVLDDGHLAVDPGHERRRRRSLNDEHSQAPGRRGQARERRSTSAILTGDTTSRRRSPTSRRATPTRSLATHASPRQVAGGPLAENILKCQLKPLDFGDYTGVTFTAEQQTRLQRGVPGRRVRLVEARRRPAGSAISPLTYAAGPGGAPLPPAPTSVPIGG